MINGFSVLEIGPSSCRDKLSNQQGRVPEPVKSMIGLRFPLLPENHTHLHLHLHHHHTNAHHIHHCALPYYVLPYYPIHSAYARTCKIIVNSTSGSSLLAVNWLCALVKIPEANKKISRDMLVLVLYMTFPPLPKSSPPMCVQPSHRRSVSTVPPGRTHRVAVVG